MVSESGQLIVSILNLSVLGTQQQIPPPHLLHQPLDHPRNSLLLIADGPLEVQILDPALAARDDLVRRRGVGDVAVHAQPQRAVGGGLRLEDVLDGGVGDEAHDVALCFWVDLVDKDDHQVDVGRVVFGVADGHGLGAAAIGALGAGHVQLGVPRTLELLEWLLPLVLGQNLLGKEACVDRDH